MSKNLKKKIIKEAVKRLVKEHGEVFKWLANEQKPAETRNRRN
jgi:hypothetical protein